MTGERTSGNARAIVATGALALLVSLFACSTSDTENAAEDPRERPAASVDDGRLVLERPVEIALEGAGASAFSIGGEPGRAYRILIDARGNDLRIAIVDPDGGILRDTGGNGSTWGLESVSFVDSRAAAEGDGGLTLEIHVLARSGGDAVRVEWLPLGAPVAEANRIIGAEELLAAARRERGATLERDAEARRKAIASAEVLASASDPRGEAIAALEVASICIETPGQAGQCVWQWGGRALRIAEGLTSPRLVDQALPILGLGELLTNNRAAARTLLERAVVREAETTTLRHQARAQIFLSAFHQGESTRGRTREDREAAVKLRRGAAERACELFRRAGDRLGEAEANATLGGYCRRTGDIADSIRHYRQVEAALRVLPPNPRAEADLYNNLGVHYRSLGRYEQALETYNKVLEIIETTGFGPRSFIYTNLGRLNLLLGDYEAAIELHKRVLEEQPARAAIGLGHCYRALGRNREALDSFRFALENADASRELRAWALDGEGLALIELGHYPEAAESLQLALQMYRETLARFSEALVLRSLGLVAWRSGDPAAAKTKLFQARGLMEELGESFRVATIDELLGVIEHSEGHLEAALSRFERATSAYERLRSDLGDVERRANFFASRQDHYLDFIKLLSDLAEANPGAGYVERAYEVSEQARARSLVDQLRRARWETKAEPESSLLDELREITARLDWLHERIDDAAASETPDRSRLDELRAEVESLQAARARKWDQIREELPRYAELRSPSPVPLERVQDLLSPRSALLQFSTGAEESYLFVVTDEEIRLFVLAATRESIEHRARSLHRNIARRRADESALTREATRLYTALVAPAAAFLEGRSEWIIVPDGPLYSIPFEVLMVDNGGEPTYLLERAAIHYVQSATTLATLQSPRDSRSATAGLTAFADSSPDTRPLRGAREEIERIARIVESQGSPVHPFFGRSASEETVKTSRAVQTARWLHFATHADFDAGDPASSGIVLSPSNDDDGLLTSGEVLGLRLNANLVVLSGCETGLGKEQRGEGIVGLTRAFMYAGARSVIVSLWRVEDQSTAELMVGFYEAIDSRHGKAEALRAAKLRLAFSEQWSHPFYWAPFVLVGPS